MEMIPHAATPAQPTTKRNYPMPRPADDPRFTFGLVIDVSQALTERGYPQPTGADLAELQQALFRFLYREGGDR
ncbi:hypothetical protein [Micromonospora sp. DT47]|uniref:hypothetical protein n=1 Tax=Micromonospora sp. DT47 TaxID=3393431 RepID=UPI003CE865EF